MKEKVSFKMAIRDTMFITKYAFKISPIYYTFFIISKTIMNVSFGLISVFIIKYVIDGVGMNKNFKEMAITLILIGLSYFVLEMLESFLNMSNEIKSTKNRCKIQKKLIEKAANLDLICYDNPEFFNEFVKAIGESDEKVNQSIDMLTTLVSNSVSILTIGGVILYVDPIIALFPITAFLVSLVTQVKSNKVNYDYDMEVYSLNRKRDYSRRIFYQPEYSKELRLTNIKNPLIKQFKVAIVELKEVAQKYGFKIAFWRFLNLFFTYTFVTYLCQPLYLGWRCMVSQTLSLGDFAAMTNASNVIRSKLNLVNKCISQFHRIGLYAGHFRKFLEFDVQIENLKGNKILDNNALLKVENLSFKYNNSSKNVIDNINMTIKPKEKIAIVGHNGAGKSTFIKLLLRLYEPSQGRILYDGLNIDKYVTNEYRKLFGVVFQDHQIFAATLLENIYMDSVNLCSSDEVNNAISVSGLKGCIERLDKGVNTVLTKEFDNEGVMLSGGEAQKLAITRMLMRDFSFAILDEASSALDPIAEYNLNKNLIEVTKDKTIIFISHRLSTTRMVDKIYMFSDGKIIEEGSHEKLMELDGAYAEMFRKQAYYYNL